MSSWLGIAIFVLFSLGLNVFMRWHVPNRKLPEDLNQWRRCGEPGQGSASESYTERRVLLSPGGWLRKTRLVEQRRVRRASDGAIVSVLPERTLHGWRGS